MVNCYISGNGVTPDISKFKEWLFKLAKLPNPESLIRSGYITSSRLEIAHFYRDGEHFNHDNYQNYLWYIIYNESKGDFSVLKQNEIICEIRELEKQLTKSQLKNAPKDAEHLLGRKLLNIKELHKNTL